MGKEKDKNNIVKIGSDNAQKLVLISRAVNSGFTYKQADYLVNILTEQSPEIVKIRRRLNKETGSKKIYQSPTLSAIPPGGLSEAKI